MNLKELSSPIRMYWDIGPSVNGGIDHLRIAGEIAAAKILSLQITVTGEKPGEACRIILGRLKDKPVALSLVLPLSAWNEDTLGLIHSFPIKLLLISTSSPNELKSILPIQNHIAGKPAFGAAFSVKRDNFFALPEVLKFCIHHRIENMALPMQRLIGHEEIFSSSPEERRKLTSNLNRIERPAWLKIIIHDPFLWRAFYPSIEFPDGGCHAANTMLYISPQADVYPCPTLPVKIGNLQQMSLKDIITSDLKKEIRKSILSAPTDCKGCEELKQCKGGCRGRAYAVNKTFNSHDPACK